jgi:hypothetical protein
VSRNGHFLLGASHAVPELAQAARQFGSPLRRPISYGGTVITPEMQESLARTYASMPSHDPHAEQAYGAMRDETRQQFEHMTASRSRGGLGMHVGVTPEDPYAGPAEMMNHVFRDRRINVMSTKTTGGHPFFSDDENDMFRAVHDVFGHAATGRGFDRHGEEAAFQAHSQMFSPLAQRALATETRGQNAVLIRRGAFPEQKIGLLPERLSRPTTMLGSPASLAASQQQAKVFNSQQFGGLLGALKQSLA